jgi:hypothetical protein
MVQMDNYNPKGTEETIGEECLVYSKSDERI